MQQNIHLLDRRASVLTDFPESTPVPIVLLIKTHSLLYQHTITYKDFDTHKSWSPKSIGCVTIDGSTHQETKWKAIQHICQHHELVVHDETKKPLPSLSFYTQMHTQPIPHTHYVYWKHMDLIPDILECFWRDRHYVTPDDFICVAERTGGYTDPSIWTVSVSHVESEQQIQMAISEIASRMEKTVQLVAKETDDMAIARWDTSIPRSGIPDQVWKEQHPYFRYAKYSQNGFLFLPSNKIQRLPTSYGKKYDAILKNNVTQSIGIHWRKELLGTVQRQREQFQTYQLDTIAFSQCEQWTLPELLYFLVCPPRPTLAPKTALIDSIQQQIHQTIHFQLGENVIYLTDNKKTTLIMYMKQDFANYFQCPSPIPDKNNFVFIVGLSTIVSFLHTISQQHTIPMSALYKKPQVARDECTRLLMIQKAVQIGGGQPQLSLP